MHRKLLYKIILLFGICFCFISCKEKNKNEIKITESQALQIAKRYGISGDNVEIYFDTYTYSKTTLGYQKGKRKLYYWYVSKNVIIVHLYKLTLLQEMSFLKANTPIYIKTWKTALKKFTKSNNPIT